MAVIKTFNAIGGGVVSGVTSSYRIDWAESDVPSAIRVIVSTFGRTAGAGDLLIELAYDFGGTGIVLGDTTITPGVLNPNQGTFVVAVPAVQSCSVRARCTGLGTWSAVNVRVILEWREGGAGAGATATHN